MFPARIEGRIIATLSLSLHHLSALENLAINDRDVTDLRSVATHAGNSLCALLVPKAGWLMRVKIRSLDRVTRLLGQLRTFIDFHYDCIYGSEFWTMYNWPFSDLEHFYYTWFAPSYSETISFGVVVKSTNRAFRKHILYIPLLIFVHHTGLQMQKKLQKKWQKVMFLHFFIFSEPSCKFSSYITDII